MERLMGNLNQVLDHASSKPKEPSKEELLRKNTDAMTTADAIQRITLAHKDGNFFRLLQLPPPDADELGRPVWAVSDSDISKAYRKLSVLVHPDKNPSAEARQAFEYLNQAYRELRDPDKREERLKQAAKDAVKERERREAAATGEERLALLSQQVARKKQLEKQQVASFNSEIVAQMMKRKQAAEQRKKAVDSSRYKQYAAAEQAGGQDSDDAGGAEAHRQQQKPSTKEARRRQSSSSSSDSEQERRKAAARKRKKPSFMWALAAEATGKWVSWVLTWFLVLTATTWGLYVSAFLLGQMVSA